MIAHYTADAHQPFHAVLNYDGQLTGQWGIHHDSKRSWLCVQIEAAPVADPAFRDRRPREFIFAALTASFALAQPILDADKAAVSGRDFYDDGYFAVVCRDKTDPRETAVPSRALPR